LQSNNNEENNSSSSPDWVYYLVSIVLEIIFSILASMLVMWFSRYREYRADE
jgi:heat shock protein HtpX